MIPDEWNAHLATLRSGPLADAEERVLYTSAVEHALSGPGAVKKVGKRPSASAHNVRRAAAEPARVAGVLGQCGTLLTLYRAAVRRYADAVMARDEAVARRASDWRLSCAAVSLGLFVVVLVVEPAAPVFLMLMGVTFLCIALAVTSVNSRRHAGDWLSWAAWSARVWWARSMRERRARGLALRMQNASLPIIVGIVDDLLGDDQDTLYLPSSRQGLYSARSHAYVVESTASVQLKRKIDQVDDGTIAICGPRGTGKTTLLEEAERDAAFSVLVQVPATYTPHDFLLHLSSKVCEAYIADHHYPVPEFTSLGMIRRPLHHAVKALRRLLLWLAFAAVAAGVLTLALAHEVGTKASEHGPGLRQKVADGLARVMELGEDIWRGERPVAALALTVAGIALWSMRVSPSFRRRGSHALRIVLRVTALAVGVASVTSLFFDPGVERNAVRLNEKAGWDTLLAVFISFPTVVRLIWRTVGAPYLARRGRFSEPEDVKALIWFALLAIATGVWLSWVMAQDEIALIVFDDDNAARIALFCAGLALFNLSYRRGRRRTPPLVVRCQRLLYRLRTLQNATAMVSLGMPDKLGASQTTSLSLAPLTYPELVSDFRDILRVIAQEYGATLRQSDSNLPGPKVVIAIDELDRIGSEEGARAFLREVKAVFGIHGVCYLISVAEDVGAAFARRGLPHRDVTESSLDDVLHVRPCTLAESTAILEARVPGLTPPYVGLAHALSGGIPRDLIRYGRRLDEVQQETNAYEIAQLAWEMISDEMAESLAGMRVLLANEPGWTAETAAVLLHLGDLEQILATDEPPPTTFSRSTARVLMADFASRRVRPMRWWTVNGARPWPTDTGLSEPTLALLEEASAYVYFGLTLLDIFASGDFTRRREEAENRAPLTGAVQPLAVARQELLISPQSSRVIISDIRAAWGLNE
ncbi:ATP-binding protein [Streptomyces niveus]|uniref:ATP-binding protein n=1 Tax=Streptomyces niveus TaxID=193462 RepID=UPI0033AA7E38